MTSEAKIVDGIKCYPPKQVEFDLCGGFVTQDVLNWLYEEVHKQGDDEAITIVLRHVPVKGFPKLKEL